MYTIIVISITAVIVLLLGVFHVKKLILPLIFFGLITALIVNGLGWNQPVHFVHNMYLNDHFTIAFNALLIISTGLVFMFAPSYYQAVTKPKEDIYALMLFSLIGGLMMTAFENLVMLFLGIETLSLSLYLLAGSKKTDRYSNEAAMKYFLTGSVSSAFLLFGIAFVYGLSGTFNMEQLHEYIIQHQTAIPVMFSMGLALMAVGFIFKIGAVPFHFWVPDVYQGSPTLITAFMATVGKVAAFAAIFRFISSELLEIDYLWKTTIVVVSIATILYGNFAALYQNNIKRMMAYSAIAHAGYMMIALIAVKGNTEGILLLYATAYSLATIIAFSVLMMVRKQTGNYFLKSFQGFGKQHPLAAFSMTVAMLSLAGIPPLIGFSAKYQLFASAIEQGYLGVVVVAIVGSMVSVYYYFKPVAAMYFTHSDEPIVQPAPLRMHQMLVFCMALILLVVSIFPAFIMHLI
ncbi:MAG: NADH-quinone oxidoreductase subunit N [Microbacter sp.]